MAFLFGSLLYHRSQAHPSPKECQSQTLCPVTAYSITICRLLKRHLMINEDDAWDEDNPIYRLNKGDRLFVDHDERTLLDNIEEYVYKGYKRQSFHSIAHGYKEAADRLVQSLESYPIFF